MNANAELADRQHDQADDRAGHARAHAPSEHGVRRPRLPPGRRGLPDRARAGRADERPRPAARDAAAERRRRGRGPRLQRRARLGRALRRDDERPRARARAHADPLHDAESGSTRRATTRAPPTSSSWRSYDLQHEPFFARGGPAAAVRCCGPATTSASSPTERPRRRATRGSTASRPGTRSTPATCWSPPARRTA